MDARGLLEKPISVKRFQINLLASTRQGMLEEIGTVLLKRKMLLIMQFQKCLLAFLDFAKRLNGKIVTDYCTPIQMTILISTL